MQALREGPAVLLRGNGQVTVGRTIPEAVMMAIYLEEAAEILYGALQIGTPIPLTPDESAKRRSKRSRRWIWSEPGIFSKSALSPINLDDVASAEGRIRPKPCGGFASMTLRQVSHLAGEISEHERFSGS